MNTRIFLLTITLFFFTFFTNLPGAPPVTPQPVPRLAYRPMPNDWYLQQARLWEAEVKKNPQNARAWYNYYFASRYAWPKERTPQAFQAKKQKLDQIVQQMEKAIPGTYEMYYIKYFHHFTYKTAKIEWLKKAYQLQPQNTETYYSFLTYYATHNQPEKFKQFALKLYKSKDIAPGLLWYNYNTLISCAKDGILITNGDNDTFPAWVLQQAKGIRPDVLVLNFGLIRGYPEYLNALLQSKNISIELNDLKKASNPNFLQSLIQKIVEKYPQQKIYLALTLNPAALKNIQENLYLVGLCYQFSKKDIDNLALLKNTVMNKFKLDYLRVSWYDEDYLANESINQLNLNYAVVFKRLADHQKLSGLNEQADYWQNFALYLARKAKDQNFVNFLEGKTN